MHNKASLPISYVHSDKLSWAAETWESILKYKDCTQGASHCEGVGKGELRGFHSPNLTRRTDL